MLSTYTGNALRRSALVAYAALSCARTLSLSCTTVVAAAAVRSLPVSLVLPLAVCCACIIAVRSFSVAVLH